MTQSTLQQTADHLMFSRMVWFSRPGSGDAIRPVTAAFSDAGEAFTWAKNNPSDFVHFPSRDGLNAGIAASDGYQRWMERAIAEPRA